MPRFRCWGDGFLVCILAGLLAPAATLAVDWPQFRGPNGDSTTAEQLRTDWTAKPPVLVWKTTVTDGFSSIAVGQGKVLTLVRRSVDGQFQEVCIALNAATGSEVWARPLGRALYDSGPGSGEGPRSTPTMRGDRVYVFTAWMVLACLDLNDGHVIWSKDLMADYGGRNITWQNAASPLIEGDRVIVNCDAPSHTLLALNAADGSMAWQSATEDRMTHATPVPTTLLGTRQVVFYAQSGLVSVDPADGTVLWRQSVSYNGTSAAASSVIGGNLVYCAADYGTGARVVRVEKSGGTFSAAQIAPVPNQIENQWSTPVHYGGYLFGCYGRYNVVAPLECYRLDTLDLMWSEPGFGHGGGLIAQDKLVMLTEDGQLVLIEPTPSAYTELGRFQAVVGKCWNVPALSGGRLYARSVRELAVYDVSALPPPTAARLAYCRATAVGRGQVRLTWRTLVEVSTLGFQVERDTLGGGWQRVTDGIIPALGSDQGPHTYGLLDTPEPLANGLKYRLLEVDHSGSETVVAEAIVKPAVVGRASRSRAGVTVEFRGQPGTVVAMETAVEIAGPWTSLRKVALDDQGTAAMALDISVGETARFYRWEQD